MDPDQTGMMPRRKVTTSVSVLGSHMLAGSDLDTDGGGGKASGVLERYSKLCYTGQTCAQHHI